MCFINTFDARTVHRTKREVNIFYSLLLLDPTITERTEELGPILPTALPIMANKVGRNLGSTLGPIFKRRRSAQTPLYTYTNFIAVHTRLSNYTKNLTYLT